MFIRYCSVKLIIDTYQQTHQEYINQINLTRDVKLQLTQSD